MAKGTQHRVSGSGRSGGLIGARLALHAPPVGERKESRSEDHEDEPEDPRALGPNLDPLNQEEDPSEKRKRPQHSQESYAVRRDSIPSRVHVPEGAGDRHGQWARSKLLPIRGTLGR